MLNWQWVLSDILGENSIKKRRSNSFQKAFERRLCFDWIAGVTGIFERISFLLQKSHFVFHDHRISFCGIYLSHNPIVPIFSHSFRKLTAICETLNLQSIPQTLFSIGNAND